MVVKSRKFTVAFLVVSLLVLAFGTAAHAQLLTGFESGNPFEGLDYVISLVTSTDWASEGSRSLRINHGSIPAVDANRLWIRVSGDTDWSGATTVQADFYVPEDSPHNYSAALMVQVGDSWTWYESSKVELVPGENLDVTFTLTDDQWRTASTGWQPGATPPLSGMKVYGFLVFTDDRSPGYLYLDNVRLHRPAAAAADGAAVTTASGGFQERIRISGKAELTVISQPEVVSGSAPMEPVGLAAHWEHQGGGVLELVTTIGIDGTPVQALRVEALGGDTVRVDLGGADLSAFKFIRMDIKQVGGTTSKGLQFIMQNSAFSWHDTQHFPHVPADGWARIELTLDQFTNNPSFSDIKYLGFRTFDGNADWLIANVYFVGEAGESTTTTSLTRSHNVSLNLDYQIAPEWTFRIGALLNDPILQLGLVELKGNAGSLALRGFMNGTSADLGDPLTLFKGSKFHENKTTGFDARASVGSGTLHGFLVMPPKENTDKRTVLAGTYNFPIGALGNATLLAYNESAEGVESKAAFGGAAKLFVAGSEVVLEAARGGQAEKAYVWMAQLNRALGERVNVKLHWRSFGADMGQVLAYNDHNKDGYDQKYIDASWKLTDQLSASVYLQNYATHNGWHDENLTKLGATWSGSGLTFEIRDETSKLAKPAGAQDEHEFNKGHTFFKGTTGIAGFDLVGILLLKKTASDGNLPAYIGRVSFEPITDLVVLVELAQVTSAVGAQPTNNTHAKVTKKFQNGELSLAFGKKTLNDNEDEVNNPKTAEDYIELKASVAF